MPSATTKFSSALVVAIAPLFPSSVWGGDSGDQAELVRMLSAQLNKCWVLPQSDDHEVPTVTLKWNLESDGRVSGSIDVMDPPPIKSTSFEIAVDAAKRAVNRCSPLKLPKDRYASWKTIVWEFVPKGGFDWALGQVRAGPISSRSAEFRRTYRKSLLARITAVQIEPLPKDAPDIAANIDIAVVVNKSGELLGSKLNRGSGYHALDEMALERVRRAAPFPVPPMEIGEGPHVFSLGFRYETAPKQAP
ncbi:energy transducer TonB [Hyphomicrobium sp.]|uniref:energy transducer TonB family protein n=1 Tax=Hyphomicrobium sp. TaxID=82 RepID=UPI002E36B9B8|nr:energy transducer TonB [Hyphomicrobium sp.]HEX2840332.1 energy transducer TonB [Hyphomicrobium sp.]